MVNELNYKTIMWAEMKPDVYSGDNCDKIADPRFECFCDGDMSSEHIETITLAASSFPPGTKVLVELPCCPLCEQEVEMCESDDNCDFDWVEWCHNEYS